MHPKYLLLIIAQYMLTLALHIPGQDASRPIITQAPDYTHRLDKREFNGPNIFGYVDGDINQPMGCAAGFALTRAIDAVAGCCNQAACTSLYFTCVNEGIENPCDGALGGYCSLYPGIVTALSCGGATPSCRNYMILSNSKDLNPLLLPHCATAGGNIEVFRTAKNNADATQPSTQTASKSSIGRTTLSPNVPRPTGDTGSSLNSGAQGGDSILAGSAPDGTSPKTGSQPQTTGVLSTRAIVALSIVGGVVLIVMAFVGTCCWCGYKKKVKKRLRPDAGPDKVDIAETVITNWRRDVAELTPQTSQEAIEMARRPSAPLLPPRQNIAV